jgi:hypothetical protein
VEDKAGDAIVRIPVSSHQAKFDRSWLQASQKGSGPQRRKPRCLTF